MRLTLFSFTDNNTATTKTVTTTTATTTAVTTTPGTRTTEKTRKARKLFAKVIFATKNRREDRVRDNRDR